MYTYIFFKIFVVVVVVIVVVYPEQQCVHERYLTTVESNFNPRGQTSKWMEVNRTCSCWEYCLLSKLPLLSNNGKFSFSAALCALSSFGLLSWVWSTSPGGPPTCMSCIRRTIALSPAARPVFVIHCPVFDSNSCFLRQRMHTHITWNQMEWTRHVRLPFPFVFRLII